MCGGEGRDYFQNTLAVSGRWGLCLAWFGGADVTDIKKVAGSFFPSLFFSINLTFLYIKKKKKKQGASTVV